MAVKELTKDGKLHLGVKYAGQIFVVQSDGPFAFDLICLDEPDAQRGPVRRVSQHGKLHIDAMFRGQLFTLATFNKNRLRIEMLVSKRSSEAPEAAYALLGEAHLKKSKLFANKLVYEPNSNIRKRKAADSPS